MDAQDKRGLFELRVLAEDITRIRFVFYFVVKFFPNVYLFIYTYIYFIRIQGRGARSTETPMSRHRLVWLWNAFVYRRRSAVVRLGCCCCFCRRRPTPLSPPAQSYPVFSVNTDPTTGRSRADYPDKFPSSGEDRPLFFFFFHSRFVVAHARPGHGLRALRVYAEANVDDGYVRVRKHHELAEINLAKK